MAKAFTPKQFGTAMKKFTKGVNAAVIRGFNNGLKTALRVAVTITMEPSGGKSAPVLPNKIRVRSGKLRRSVKIFKARKQGNNWVGGLQAGGRGVPYARIHEKGGVTHPKVTPRMRGFAWHMFAKTNEPFWRGLALTKKKTLTVRIPKRPYLEPALVLSKGEIGNQVDKSVARWARKSLG